jgi:hypothetical protein
MKPGDRGRQILWSARAYTGGYLGECEALPLLSSTSGEAELRNIRRLLSPPAARQFAAMLINLSERARYYCPLEPKATPCLLMTVFVEHVENRSTDVKVLVARLDVVLDGCCAFASITAEREPRIDVPAVAYDGRDGVWDIVLKGLRAIFSTHIGP